MARLQEYYRNTVVKQLMEQFGYKSVMEVPRIHKITLNMGVGEAVADKKVMDNAVGDMQKIAGQKPVVTKAKKSIATFKVREGYPVGCMVTLRRIRMYEFLDRLVNVAIPRIRDFRGISARSFDGRGNYNMGIKEQIIFPEIEYDKIDVLRGMNITITTTASMAVFAPLVTAIPLSFTARSIFPESITLAVKAELGIIPACFSARMSMSSPAILSKADKRISAIFFLSREIKPRFGRRRCMGIWPPSNPTL